MGGRPLCCPISQMSQRFLDILPMTISPPRLIKPHFKFPLDEKDPLSFPLFLTRFVLETDNGQPFRETVSPIELRSDNHLSAVIDISPTYPRFEQGQVRPRNRPRCQNSER